MKNLFEPATVREVKARIAHLRPESQRQWGRMTVGQAVAHCAAGFEMASGDRRPPGRRGLGRIIGRIVKPMVFRNNAPFRRNTPTMIEVTDERDLATERERLLGVIDRFAAMGPPGCTSHPHPFFGQLTPQEWSVLMYKHLDHHLRQFGV
jgi:hypothetical protein